jgi:serine protease DegQ
VRNIWLGFAQAATIVFAVLYLVSFFRPEPPPPRGEIVTVKEAAPVVPVPGATASGSYSSAAKKAMPAVVNIYTAKQVERRLSPEELLLRRFYGDQLGGRPETATSLGSGVVVSANGYVLTNNHVVEGADEIAVVIPGRDPITARVVGTDPETDLAVLKVQADNLAAIVFGNPERLQVGDIVLAIGNPFGVGQTVTQGIVSATGRSRLGISTFENFIQTDAAINPGNSGGALVDISGNLVGINTAIFSKTEGSVGIGFAIPVNLARQVMEQIIKQGRVERGWIGVQAQDIPPEAAESGKRGPVTGALIAGVVRGTPADKAGLKRGDIVIAINGKPIADVTDLSNLTAALKPGERGEFTVLREGREVRLAVEVGARPRQPKS